MAGKGKCLIAGYALASWLIFGSNSIDEAKFYGTKIADGYICESLSPSSRSRSPSEILSTYFGESVHLVYKGPSPRACNPTVSHPQLKATFLYQDCYPLLVLSEESVSEIERQLRGHVGTQGIEERWNTEPLVIERYVGYTHTFYWYI